jgi:hypothetical protein
MYANIIECPLRHTGAGHGPDKKERQDSLYFSQLPAPEKRIAAVYLLSPCLFTLALKNSTLHEDYQNLQTFPQFIPL